jgi:Tfp pilus assembly protein PilN
VKAVNLIPPDERAGGGSFGGRSGGGAYAVIGLLLGLAALAALYASAHHQIAVKEGEASQLSAEANQAKEEASRLAPYTHFVTLRDERVSDVQELAGTRFDWAHMMHELGRVLPGDASLNGVQGTVGSSEVSAASLAESSSTETTAAGSGSSVTSSTPAGSAPNLTLTGCATSQAAVALTMDRLRLMNGVSEVSLQSSASSGSSTSGEGGAGCNQTSFTLTVGFEGLPTPQTPSSASGSSSSSTSDEQSSTEAASGVEAGQGAPR